jgi:hypothetical protein
MAFLSPRKHRSFGQDPATIAMLVGQVAKAGVSISKGGEIYGTLVGVGGAVLSAVATVPFVGMAAAFLGMMLTDLIADPSGKANELMDIALGTRLTNRATGDILARGGIAYKDYMPSFLADDLDLLLKGYEMQEVPNYSKLRGYLEQAQRSMNHEIFQALWPIIPVVECIAVRSTMFLISPISGVIHWKQDYGPPVFTQEEVLYGNAYITPARPEGAGPAGEYVAPTEATIIVGYGPAGEPVLQKISPSTTPVYEGPLFGLGALGSPDAEIMNITLETVHNFAYSQQQAGGTYQFLASRVIENFNRATQAEISAGSQYRTIMDNIRSFISSLGITYPSNTELAQNLLSGATSGACLITSLLELNQNAQVQLEEQRIEKEVESRSQALFQEYIMKYTASMDAQEPESVETLTAPTTAPITKGIESLKAGFSPITLIALAGLGMGLLFGGKSIKGRERRRAKK